MYIHTILSIPKGNTYFTIMKNPKRVIETAYYNKMHANFFLLSFKNTLH